MGGLGDGDDVALDEEAEGDLGCGFAEASADLLEGFVGEEVGFAFGEGGPTFGLDVVFGHGLTGEFLLVEDVGFDLVDLGRDFGEGGEVG